MPSPGVERTRNDARGQSGGGGRFPQSGYLAGVVQEKGRPDSQQRSDEAARRATWKPKSESKRATINFDSATLLAARGRRGEKRSGGLMRDRLPRQTGARAAREKYGAVLLDVSSDLVSYF